MLSRSILAVLWCLTPLRWHPSARLRRLPAPSASVCSRAGGRLAHGRAPLTTQLAAGAAAAAAAAAARGSSGMEGGEAGGGSGRGRGSDWGGGGGAGYAAITQVFEPQPDTLVQLAWSHWECAMLDLLAAGQQLLLLCLLGFHITGLNSMSARQRGHKEHSSWKAEAAPCESALTQGIKLGQQVAGHWCTLIRQFAGDWQENSVLCACCTCLRAAC